MEYDLGLKTGVTTTISHPPSRICETIRRKPRYLWTVCAATSLLSAKYLFINAHLNFPVHLHFIQLIAISIYTFIEYSRSRPECADDSSRPRKTSWGFLTFVASIMALSVICTLQAVLHLHNTTALIMLSMVACLVEQLTYMISSRSRRYQDYLWLVPITVGCSGVLAGEYRLYVAGLEAALPAVLLTGLSRALYSISADTLTMTDSDARRLNMLYCCVALPITGIWEGVFTPRPWSFVIDRFPWRMAPLLAVNVASTAVAIVLGKSVLLPTLRSEHRTTFPYRNEARSRDTVTILIMVGIIGVSSTLTIHRSYTTYVQFCAFFVAVIFFGSNAIKETIRTWGYTSMNGYARVGTAIGLESVDGDPTTTSEDTEWSGETQVSRPTARPIRTFASLIGVAVLGVLFWMAFPSLNFQDSTLPPLPKGKTLLDLEYRAPIANEIVISMYKEPVADVQTLISTLRKMPTLSQARVSIYIKDSEANIDTVKRTTGADAVIPLPNIGREGETYLNHILTQWDHLAHETIFLQADVHNPREFYPRIQNYYIPSKTGMLNLAWSGNVCDCHDCADRWLFVDHAHLFPKFHQQINNNGKACEDVLLSYKGQFVVSAKRIRGVKKEVYRDLRQAFVDEKGWAHQQEFLLGDYDSMSQPKFGYFMERMWNMLFQCADTEVAWKCPTLLSGWRIGGSKADCQCFDD